MTRNARENTSFTPWRFSRDHREPALCRSAFGGLSALAAGLMHLGIPKEAAIKYENAITSDKFLVIAHATPEEVAQARLIVGDAMVPNSAGFPR
jgi:hypothetical protein